MIKQFVSLAVLAIFSAAVSAQTGNTSFGLRAGVNFQNLNGKDGDGDKLDNQLKTGFNVGLNVEIPVATDFYIQPGVLFSTKGAKDKDVLGDEDLTVNLSYIEIPINILYKPVLGDGRLLLGFGPYIAFGVAGNAELGDAERDVKWENEITIGQSIDLNPYFRRMDAGANLLFGYEWSSKLSAQLNAQLGLVKINPDVSGFDDDTSVKNTGFGISLGYRF